MTLDVAPCLHRRKKFYPAHTKPVLPSPSPFRNERAPQKSKGKLRSKLDQEGEAAWRGS
jgi:hypothetical protein